MVIFGEKRKEILTFLYRKCNGEYRELSDDSVTLETPTAWSMPRRTGIHTWWKRYGIETALGTS